jgi:hypothetical protein
MEVETLQHLLILCCYGGVPYIDYQQLGNNNKIKHESTMSLDPTDWIAVDSSGSLLNNTIHPEILQKNPLLSLLIPPNTSLDQCDLYNLTFSSAGDEHLYELGHGKLSCRCPLSRTGVACQSHFNPLPSPQSLSSNFSNMGSSGDPFATYMLASIFLMIAMILLFFSMMKGCFCDCFGGFQNPFKRASEEPVDPIAISRCLHAVNEYEEKQKQQGYPDVHRPLISSVTENFAAPYNDTVYPSSQQYQSAPRNCSPPPSYRSDKGSMEYLPGAHAKTQL